MTTKANFQHHYSSLHDEDLMQIAIKGNLLPDAQIALSEELRKRGIRDLSSFKEAMDRDAAAEEKQRQEQIARKSKLARFITATLYVVAFLCCQYGVYRWFVPGDESPKQWISMGLAILVFAWLRARISKTWIEDIIHRRPPR